MNKKIKMYFGLPFLVAGSTFACVSISQHKKITKNSFFVKRSNKYLANKLKTESNGLAEDLKNALAKEEKISSVYEIENNFYLISNNKLKYFDPNSREFVVISDKNKNAKSIEKIGNYYYLKLVDRLNKVEMKKVVNGKLGNTVVINLNEIKKAFKIGNKEMIFSFDYRPVKDSFYVFCDGQTKEVELPGLAQYDGIKDIVEINGSVFIFTYQGGIFKLNTNSKKYETKIVLNSKMNIAEVFNFKKDCIFSYGNDSEGYALYWLNIVENKIEKIDGIGKVGINYAKFRITENKGKFYLITKHKTKEIVRKDGKWSFQDFKNNDGSNFLIKPSTIFKTTTNNKKLLYFVGTNNKLYKLSATDPNPIPVTGIVYDGKTQVVPENKIFKINNIIYYSRFSTSNGLVIYKISKDGLSAEKVLESKENKEAPIYSQTKENLYIIFKKETFIIGDENGRYLLDGDMVFNKYNGYIDGIKTINYHGEKINFVLTKPVFNRRKPNHSYLVPNVNFIKKQSQLNNEQILILKKISKFNKGALILPAPPMSSVYEYKVGQSKWSKSKPNNLNNIEEIWIRLAPSENTFLSKNNQQNKSNGFLIKLSELKQIDEMQKVLLYKDIEFTSGFISVEEQEGLIKLRNEAINQYGYNLFKVEYERLIVLNKTRQKIGYDKANKNKYNNLGFPNSSNKMTLAQNSNKKQMDDYVKDVQAFNTKANKKLGNAKASLQKELDKFVNTLAKEQIDSLRTKIKNDVKNYSTCQEMEGIFSDINKNIQIKKNNKYNDLGFHNANKKINLVFDAGETQRNEYKKSVAFFNNAAKLKLEQAKALLQTKLDELKDILNDQKMETLKKKINNDVNDKKTRDVLFEQIKNIKINSDIISKNPYVDLGFDGLPSKISLNLNANQEGVNKFLTSVSEFNKAAANKLSAMKEALKKELKTMSGNSLLSSGEARSFEQKIKVGKNKSSLESIRNILEEVKNKQTNDKNKYNDLGFKSSIKKLILEPNAGQKERNAFKKSVADFNKGQTTKLGKAKDILKIKLADFKELNILSAEKTSKLESEINSKIKNNDKYEEMLAKLQNIQKNYVIIKYKHYIDLGFDISSNKITLELTAANEQVLEYMKSVEEFNQKAKEQLKKSKESLLTMAGNIKSISDKEKNLLQEEINNNVTNNKTYQEVKQKINNINFINNTVLNHPYNDLGFSGLPEKQTLKHNASGDKINEYIKSVASFNNAAKLKLKKAKALLQTKSEKLKNILNNQQMATLKNEINSDANDKESCDVLSVQIKNIKTNSNIISKNPYIDLGFPDLPNRTILDLNATQEQAINYKQHVKEFNDAAKDKLEKAKKLLKSNLKKFENILGIEKINSLKYQINNNVNNYLEYQSMVKKFENIKLNNVVLKNNKYNSLGFPRFSEKFHLFFDAGKESRAKYIKNVKEFNNAAKTKLKKSKVLLKQKLNKNKGILTKEQIKVFQKRIENEINNYGSFQKILLELKKIIQKDKDAAKADVKKKKNIKWLLIGGIPAIGMIIFFILYRKFKIPQK